MLSFCLATFFGGLSHSVAHYALATQRSLASVNVLLPWYFKLGSLHQLETRLWFVTFLCIGFTEYYFMYIFLHPMALRAKSQGVIRYLQGMFGLFVFASFFTMDYPLVIIFHVISHTIVILLSFYLIVFHKQTSFRYLIALCVFNLLLGGLWSLQGLGKIPSPFLHPNDWYHLGLIAFAITLHQMLIRSSILKSLHASEFNCLNWREAK